MKPQRVYVDTSVFGVAFEVEFAVDSEAFLGEINNGRLLLIRSEVTDAEILPAPEVIRLLYESFVPSEYLQITVEAEELQQPYFQAAALSSKSFNDAMHVALATIARTDCIVSWNFKHLVNYGRIKAFNAVNLALGYALIDIRSPKEMIP